MKVQIIGKIILMVMFLFHGTLIYAEGGKEFNFVGGLKTKIQKPFQLRDPFKQNIKASKENRIKQQKSNLEYSDKKSIDGVPLENISIVGILLGKQRRAIAKVGSETDVYVLKEGMFLGEDQAEIKAILPGGIVLVEKIRNIYDQDEYLETIIPISSKTEIGK